jgi:hypothetical protein
MKWSEKESLNLRGKGKMRRERIANEELQNLSSALKIIGVIKLCRIRLETRSQPLSYSSKF